MAYHAAAAALNKIEEISMNVQIEIHDGVSVVRMPVRLALANSAVVRRTMDEHIESVSSRLVIDLSGAEFVDSSGLAALLAVIKTARRRGGDLVLASPRPRVLALIELTRLDDVVAILPTVTDAIERLATASRAA
jgi:anti-sigma B factor antagonist